MIKLTTLLNEIEVHVPSRGIFTAIPPDNDKEFFWGFGHGGDSYCIIDLIFNNKPISDEHYASLREDKVYITYNGTLLPEILEKYKIPYTTESIFGHTRYIFSSSAIKNLNEINSYKNK